MTKNSEKTFCYRHPTRETRISCSECGNYICTECMIQAPVGQKCPDCVSKNEANITKITKQEYILSIACGGIASILGSYIWSYTQKFGIFIMAIVAYMLGFIVAKAITSIVGNKIGFKIQAIAGSLVFVGILYNPILYGYNYLTKDFNPEILLACILAPANLFSNLITEPFGGSLSVIISIAIAIWASVRHFKL